MTVWEESMAWRETPPVAEHLMLTSAAGSLRRPPPSFLSFLIFFYLIHHLGKKHATQTNFGMSLFIAKLQCLD